MKKSEVRLTQLASAAGCGAKIGPKVLAQVVGKLPKFTDSKPSQQTAPFRSS